MLRFFLSVRTARTINHHYVTLVYGLYTQRGEMFTSKYLTHFYKHTLIRQKVN